MAKSRPAGLHSYLVECYWPGLTRPHVMLTARRARETAARLAGQGNEIIYRATFLVPEDEVAFCLFDAASAVTVEEACRQAEVPFDRIVSVVPISPR